MPAPSITSSDDGVVAVVAIDRPDRANALSIEAMDALRLELGEAASRARGIVLTGAGGTFCGGADLDDLRRDPTGLAAALTALRSTMLDLPVPVVAAVEGGCVGGGVEVAMACDVRIASATAAFEIPAARLSVAYPEAGLDVLRRRLPHQTLSRLFLLNERIPAAEAVAAGLVARVVEPGGALAAARVALGRLADLDPATVTDTKHRL